MARALTILAEGQKPEIAKPLTGLGSGVMALAPRHRGDAFRAVCALRIGDDIWVVHAFQRKSETGSKTPKQDIDLIDARLKRLKGDAEMNDDTDMIRGSGNVFRDLGHPDADREQLRALLAARIIGVLDEGKLTVRAAQEVTGVAAADFSRIRKAKLGRFTIDRLMTILSGLGQEVEVTVDIHPRRVGLPGAEVQV
jgi:phage-related protein/predicted XRE-type DNA-binding protein